MIGLRDPATAGPPTVAADRVAGAAGLRGWLAAHAAHLRELVGREGAVRVTGLPIGGAGDVAAARTAIGARPAYAREHFAPRRVLGDGVYAPPEWEPDREMCPHHEQSFGVDFPGLLLIACLSAPTSGGDTLLVDTRRMVGAVPARVVARLRRQGWRLVRTFRPYFGLSWADAYGAAGRDAVARFCAERAIESRWEPDGTLRTAQRRPAVVRHPATGAECWFNDLAFLSLWSVDQAERDVLRQTFGADGVPLNTTYGDAQELDEPAYLAIQAAYQRATRRLLWSVGDLLIVDNLLMAHGRDPYTGPLRLVHALAEPTSHPLPALPWS